MRRLLAVVDRAICSGRSHDVGECTKHAMCPFAGSTASARRGYRESRVGPRRAADGRLGHRARMLSTAQQLRDISPPPQHDDMLGGAGVPDRARCCVVQTNLLALVRYMQVPGGGW